MKNKLFVLAFCCLVLSCNGGRSGAVAKAPLRIFLSGVYVATESTDFCSVWDTLTITPDHRRENGFVVQRTTTFQRSQGLCDFPEERALQQWSAVYNEAGHMALSTGDDGDILVLLGQDRLRLGTVIYYKIE